MSGRHGQILEPRQVNALCCTQAWGQNLHRSAPPPQDSKVQLSTEEIFTDARKGECKGAAG